MTDVELKSDGIIISQFVTMTNLEALILSKKCPPIMLKNKISDWPARKWTPNYLASELTNQRYKCKIAPKDDNVLWETECVHEEITLQQFAEWNLGKPDENNPLLPYNRSDVTCYIDYKYMKDLFIEKTDHLKAVDWSVLGLESRDGNDSTIWIGSEGCYTNCHYDTYGFNLVAQIYGRKRWTLFPPSDTKYMYPTRIPYEESSVFSQVNVKKPDTTTFHLFKNSHPHVVILEPGDVLYVPRHWWHFVESLETSISINTWVEMFIQIQEEDKDSHVTEALSRVLFGCMMDIKIGSVGSTTDWINPGEEVQCHDVNFRYLQQAVDSYKKAGNKKNLYSNLTKFASQIGKYFDLKIATNKAAAIPGRNQLIFQDVVDSGNNQATEQSLKRKVSTSPRDECKKQRKDLETENLNADMESYHECLHHNTLSFDSDFRLLEPMSYDLYVKEVICSYHTEQETKYDSDIDLPPFMKKTSQELLQSCKECQLLCDRTELETAQQCQTCSIKTSDTIQSTQQNFDRDDNLTVEHFAKILLHPDVINKVKELITEPFDMLR
ncbi:HSPB1-associated protein 1 homolog isoform X2 [Mytilus californianus]|uniref:HSPB1-associated protein 1 homolog isoform X2 n=1 Tax=Mytilus californianus TaxID=6549 RepID=UPI0022484BDA|nr:HSPB1-associated protein 1 homolog isoform X2 [Mytilus californianus]